jgi:predicted nucleotidyltransferase
MESVLNDPLQTTLADAVRMLESNGIRYALVGGLAASYHGQTRVTADVDMVIAIDVERALALVDGLDATNFQPLVADVAEIVRQAFILPLRHRTTGVKVDLAIGLSGFEQQAVERAHVVQFGATLVAIVSPEDLVVMKVLAGRPQDEQDLAGIVARQPNLDWEYCVDLGAQLGEAIGQDLVGRIKALQSGRED